MCKVALLTNSIEKNLTEKIWMLSLFFPSHKLEEFSIGAEKFYHLYSRTSGYELEDMTSIAQLAEYPTGIRRGHRFESH